MGNQTFMFILVDGVKRMVITRRLYQELYSGIQNKGYSEACHIVRKAVRECPNEVRADNSKGKVDIEI